MKIFILIFLTLFSAGMAVLKFWGDWGVFSAIFGTQVLMLNTIRTYMFRKTMYLGVISLTPDAEPVDRKFICLAAVVCYLLLFLK